MSDATATRTRKPAEPPAPTPTPPAPSEGAAEPKPAKEKRQTLEPELRVMAAISRAIEAIDDEEVVGRILMWTVAKYAPPWFSVTPRRTAQATPDPRVTDPDYPNAGP